MPIGVVVVVLVAIGIEFSIKRVVYLLENRFCIETRFGCFITLVDAIVFGVGLLVPTAWV